MKLAELLNPIGFLLEDRSEYAAEVFGTKLLAAQDADSSAKQKLSAIALVKLLRDKIDPTKTKQHIVWIAKMYANKQFRLEDVARLKSDLTLFDKVRSKLKNKDLNQYKTLGDLYDALSPFENTPEEDLLSNKAKIAAVKSDVKVFIDEPDFKVVIPETHEASCFYGAGTKWCTTGHDSKETFDDYSAKGPLFILLTKLNGKNRKFQLHYEDEQFMNEKDQPVNQTEIEALSKLPGYTKFLNKLIKKHYHPHIFDK